MSGGGEKRSKRQKKGAKSPESPQSGPREFWGAPLYEWLTALGLGILIYWRPWQDGIVAADSNAAFLMGALLLFVMWSGRGLYWGRLAIPAVPCLLLAGFLVAAWLSGWRSVQYHATQTAFTIWCGHAMVFVLAASLRSGVAMGFLLAFVTVTSAAEALFSIIHLKYSLPETRIYVRNYPAAAEQLFGHELNPALVHRLNSNRAFGTLLFANALATWLVAAIPISLFGARHAFRKFQAGDELLNPIPPLARGIAIGVVAAIVSTPILSAAQQISAGVNSVDPNIVVGLPFSPAQMRLPVPAMMVVFFQVIALAIAWGVYAVLSLLIRPSSERGQETAAHALIVGVIAAGVSCIGIAVLYSRFHFFHFAEPVTVEEQMKYVRPPIHQPFLPFLFCVLVIPVSVAGVAIRITRRRGLATFVWMALAVVFGLAAVCQGAALWMTYSRGGMLALAVGMIVTLLLIRPQKAAPDTVPLFKAATAGLIVFVMLAVALGGSAHAQDPGGEAPVNPFVEDIEVGGTDMTLGDLANPTTVSLRFSYWSGSFRMAADHLITGVGLGNFGVTYPQYQPVDGGDSKQAHNDFLQLLCETGILGFAFFAAFWGWFIMAGGKWLRSEAAREYGWWLAGLYAAVIGFLVHAFVDFPFVDPSLGMLVFLLAGLFWAQARTNDVEVDRSPGVARAASLAALAIAVLVAGITVRLGHVDATVGDKRVRQQRIAVASQFLRGFEPPPDAPPNWAPSDADWKVSLVVEDAEMRKAFGTHFYRTRPDDPNWKPLPPGSPIPRDAVLMMTNLPLATEKLKEACVDWTTRFAEADAVYPHDPDFALHISVWFDMLWRSGEHATDGIEYIKQAVKWAESAVDRSPGQVAYHDWLFRMRWRRALSEPEINDQLAYYELSLDAIDRTVALYPIKPDLWDRHALMYSHASKKFAERGKAERSEECIAIMKQSQEEAASIREHLAALQNEKES